MVVQGLHYFYFVNARVFYIPSGEIVCSCGMVNKEIEGVWPFLACQLTPWPLKLTILSLSGIRSFVMELLRQDLGKICSACEQHEIQYTERRISIHVIICIILCVFFYTSGAIKI